jgi:hypothetical protein
VSTRRPEPPSNPDPEPAPDDSDVGWGEVPAADDPDDVGRFLDDRPPHHGNV